MKPCYTTISFAGGPRPRVKHRHKKKQCAFRITGCDRPAGNGVYFKNGTQNGRDRYTNANLFVVYWDPEGPYWAAVDPSDGFRAYGGSLDVPHPLDVVGWAGGDFALDGQMQAIKCQ